MNKLNIAGIVAAVVLIVGLGVDARSGRAYARENRQLSDSIAAVLLPALEAAEASAERAQGRVEAVEEAHAQDSTEWRAERAEFVREIAVEERTHGVLGDSVRAELEGLARDQFDRQQEAYELIVTSKDSIIVSQAEEIAGLGVRVAEWMALAEARQDGWDAETAAHVATTSLAQLREGELLRQQSPSLLARVKNDGPWIAAGVVLAKLTGL